MKDETARPSFAPTSVIGKKKVCIVHTKWNYEYVEQLVTQVKSTLMNHEVDIRVVPGCYELPIACQKLCRKLHNDLPLYDVVIAVGVLIKGETYHFEYISQSVCHGLMEVQLTHNIPVIFGVLTVKNEEQVKERIDMNIGKDWGLTALDMSQF